MALSPEEQAGVAECKALAEQFEVLLAKAQPDAALVACLIALANLLEQNSTSRAHMELGVRAAQDQLAIMAKKCWNEKRTS